MNTTAKTLCALMLGATLITPVLAQDSSAPAANGAMTQNAPAADAATPAAAPTTPVQSSTTANADTSTMPRTAMNATGNAADLSSVPDTQKKYTRSSRAKDYKNEAAVTAQLNQKESSLNGAGSQQ